MRCSSIELLKLLDQLQPTMTRWQAPLPAHCQLSSGCIRSIHIPYVPFSVKLSSPIEPNSSKNLTRLEVFCASVIGSSNSPMHLNSTLHCNSIDTSLKSWKAVSQKVTSSVACHHPLMTGMRAPNARLAFWSLSGVGSNLGLVSLLVTLDPTVPNSSTSCIPPRGVVALSSQKLWHSLTSTWWGDWHLYWPTANHQSCPLHWKWAASVKITQFWKFCRTLEPAFANCGDQSLFARQNGLRLGR